MTKSAQRWVPAGVPAQKGGFLQGFQQGFCPGKGVLARFQRRFPAHKGVPSRGPSRGSITFLSPLFPCILAQMPLLAPFVDWAKAARAAVGTRGYVGPSGLGCRDLAAHPHTKAAIPPGTTIARIRLTRPHLDTRRYVVDSKPAMSLPNYSLTSHPPYRWKPERMGWTTPVLMESEDAVLPLPMCHALTLIGTSESVKLVDIFRQVNEELLELGQTGHVFKEEFVVNDGDMPANMKIEADNVGQRWGGIFNVAWPGLNRPPNPGDTATVYAVIPTGSGAQEGLQLPHVGVSAQKILHSLFTKYPRLFLVKVWYMRATSDQPQLWHRHPPLELQTVRAEHAFSCLMPENVDCPMDGPVNMFMYGLGSSVPYPWQEVSMSMLAGDLWIVSSYVPHRGGAVARDALGGSNRIITFALPQAASSTRL